MANEERHRLADNSIPDLPALASALEAFTCFHNFHLYACVPLLSGVRSSVAWHRRHERLTNVAEAKPV
jgi:hypothetical protein